VGFAVRSQRFVGCDNKASSKEGQASSRRKEERKEEG